MPYLRLQHVRAFSIWTFHIPPPVDRRRKSCMTLACWPKSYDVRVRSTAGKEKTHAPSLCEERDREASTGTGFKGGGGSPTPYFVQRSYKKQERSCLTRRGRLERPRSSDRRQARGAQSTKQRSPAFSSPPLILPTAWLAFSLPPWVRDSLTTTPSHHNGEAGLRLD